MGDTFFVTTPRKLQLLPLQKTDAQRAVSWITDEKDTVLFAGPGLPHPLTVEWFLTAVTQDREVFALRDGQTIVATRALNFLDDGSARIGRVLVAPQRRSRGLGRTVMELLINRAAACPGVEIVTLGVYEHNHSARRLYESFGFVSTGERPSVQVSNQTWTSLELSYILA